MRKCLVRLGILIVFMLSTLSICYASSDVAKITRVDMSISIDEAGTAHVKEVWNATVPSGTECSKRIINLNGSEITNLTVSDELGKEYTLMSPWDSSKTRIDKFTSYGLRAGVNGDTTIFWGLGDYGERAYILNYDITNFVKACADGQYIYSTLLYIQNSLIPEKIVVDIEFPYELDNSILEAVSVYGGKYEVGLGEGSMLHIESSNYASNPYLVSLIKLPDTSSPIISTSLSTNKTWDMIYNEVEQGEGLGVVTETISIKDIAILVIIAILILLIILRILSELKIRKRISNPMSLPVKFIYDRQTSPSNIPTIEQAEPINLLSDMNSSPTLLYEAYTVGIEYGIVQNSYNLFGSLIMKWIVYGNILLLPHKEGFEIRFIKEPSGVSFETELYSSMLNSLSDIKTVKLQENTTQLEPEQKKKNMTAKEFSEWFREWTVGHNIWVEEIMRSIMRSLQDRGYCNTVTVSKRVQKRMNFIEYKVTAKMRDYAKDIQGFKKFIRMGLGSAEINSPDINPYIVYAQLFGCTNILFEKLSLLRVKGELPSNSYYSSISIEEANNTIILLNKMLSIVGMRLKAIGKNKKH